MSGNDELTSKMNQYSPKASTQDSEAEIRRRQELVNTLERLVEKASKGNATASDIAKAQGINAQLGGQYSSLVSAIESAVEQKEAAKNHVSSSISSSNANIEPVSASKEYFNQESVKKSENTLRNIESGNSVNKNDLLQTWESLHSEESCKKSKEFVAQLNQQEVDIIKKAMIEGREELTEEEKRKVAEIEKEISQHLKRENNGRVLEEVFGKYDKKRSEKILENEENQNLFKQCVSEVGSNFSRIDDMVKDNTRALLLTLSPAKQDKNPDKSPHIAALETKHAAMKEGIRQEQINSITKITKDKVVTKEENIVDQSANKSDTKEQISLSAAKAARAALKAKKNITEVKTNGHITPDHTPPIAKGEIKQKGQNSK